MRSPSLLPLAAALLLAGCDAPTPEAPVLPPEPVEEDVPLCGGYGKAEPVGQDLLNLFETAVQGTEAEGFIPKSVSSQVVAGMNYDFACTVPGSDAVRHVVIYQPLPYTREPPRVTDIR